MQRISVHISEAAKKRVDIAANAKSKTEAEIIREALDEGLNIIYPLQTSAQALEDFSNMIEKIPTEGKIPDDFIRNLDYYTWGGEKRE